MRSEPEADVVKQSGLGFLNLFDEENSLKLFAEELFRQRLVLLQMPQVSGAARELCTTLSAQSSNKFWFFAKEHLSSLTATPRQGS